MGSVWPTRPGQRPMTSTHEELIERIRHGHDSVTAWERWDEAGVLDKKRGPTLRTGTGARNREVADARRPPRR